MKKALSLVLVLILALSMVTMASAASKNIALVDKGSTYQARITMNNSSDVDLGDVVVQKGPLTITTDIINFQSFTIGGVNRSVDFNGDYAAPKATAGLTEKEIQNSRITLKTVISKGAAAINTGGTKLVYDSATKEAKVQIEFNDEFKSNNTDGIGFIVKLFLVVDGRQWSDSGLTVEGTYKNDTAAGSNASDGYVYMGDGVIVEADAYGKNIEMDIGNGVSVFGKMFKSKKYWAKAGTDSYGDDEDLLMDKYDIDFVYHIKQVGVAAVADYVKLNNESSDLFVYDGDLSYLGKGNDKLLFSETYYLAAKQLELEGGEDPIDGGDGYEVPAETGGNNDYPANVNDNPGTGR